MTDNPFRPWSEYYRMACEKNALRRLKCQPLLDINEEIQRLALEDYRLYYRSIAERHSHIRERFRNEVLRDIRRERRDLTFGSNSSARMYMSIKVQKLFSEYLERRGYPKPTSKQVPFAKGGAKPETKVLHITELSDYDLRVISLSEMDTKHDHLNGELNSPN